MQMFSIVELISDHDTKTRARKFWAGVRASKLVPLAKNL